MVGARIVGSFKKTASARSVADGGYNAMLAGKLDAVSGSEVFAENDRSECSALR